jgi:hypothetical protein
MLLTGVRNGDVLSQSAVFSILLSKVHTVSCKAPSKHDSYGRADACRCHGCDVAAMQFAMEENTLLRRAPSHARLFNTSVASVTSPLQQRAVQAAAQRLGHISASIHAVSKRDENSWRPAVKKQAAAPHQSERTQRKKAIALAQQQHDARIAETAG